LGTFPAQVVGLPQGLDLPLAVPHFVFPNTRSRSISRPALSASYVYSGPEALWARNHCA
jgi:hypothetical protein